MKEVGYYLKNVDEDLIRYVKRMFFLSMNLMIRLMG